MKNPTNSLCKFEIWLFIVIFDNLKKRLPDKLNSQNKMKFILSLGPVSPNALKLQRMITGSEKNLQGYMSATLITNGK